MARTIVPLDYVLERELKQEMAALTDYVMTGEVTDFADYKFHCGKICGIQMAIKTLSELRARLGDDDNYTGSE